MSQSLAGKGGNHDFDLARFREEQDVVYASVIKELKAGKKRTHWMWFIFPEVEGLGQSSISRHYAIKSRQEANGYLSDPVLGKRLLECATALLEIEGKSAYDIFGYPDDLKLHSSMTLFFMIAPEQPVFGQVLQKYFSNNKDARTIEIFKTL